MSDLEFGILSAKTNSGSFSRARKGVQDGISFGRLYSAATALLDRESLPDADAAIIGLALMRLERTRRTLDYDEVSIASTNCGAAQSVRWSCNLRPGFSRQSCRCMSRAMRRLRKNNSSRY